VRTVSPKKPARAKTRDVGELKRRARKILPILEKLYPDARAMLDFQSPLQLLVATILAAQCTDERVNQVTPALFAAIRPSGPWPRPIRPRWRR